MNNNLRHSGVLGMKWGHRKDRGKSSISKHSKRSDTDKVAKVEKKWKKVKDEPVSKYMQNKKAVKRGRMLVLAALGIYFFGPSIVRGGQTGVYLGKMKIRNFMSSRKFEKYGGFDPKKVVNSKMWDAPIRTLTTNLLTGGR